MLLELTAIGISLASLHIPYEGQNQFNPGIHGEFNDVIRAGVFVNSRDRVASYVGGQIYFGRFQIGGVESSIRGFAALSTGYKSPVIGGLEFVAGNVVALVAPKTKESAWTLGFALRKEM